MNIREATPEEMAATKHDRRRNNRGRAPLVDVSGWKPGERVDVSGYLGGEFVRVVASVRRQARKRGWFVREIRPGVFVRFPVYVVTRAGSGVSVRVPGRDAADAIMTASHGAAGEWSAALQE